MEGLCARIFATVLPFKFTPLLAFAPTVLPAQKKPGKQRYDEAGSEDKKAHPVVQNQPKGAIRIQPLAASHHVHRVVDHGCERDRRGCASNDDANVQPARNTRIAWWRFIGFYEAPGSLRCRRRSPCQARPEGPGRFVAQPTSWFRDLRRPAPQWR